MTQEMEIVAINNKFTVPNFYKKKRIVMNKIYPFSIVVGSRPQGISSVFPTSKYSFGQEGTLSNLPSKLSWERSSFTL